MNVIAQIRAASKSPAALLVGALLGGFVPVASFVVAHYEWAAFWTLQTLLVAGGLAYSAKTVYQWGKLAFQCGYKAAGFVVLVEGTMVLSATPWLSFAALAFLVGINATATGCTLALADDKATRAKASAAARKARKPANEVSGVRARPTRKAA